VKKVSTLLGLVGFCAIALTAGQASAASLGISDADPGETITITGGQFEYFFSTNVPNGHGGFVGFTEGGHPGDTGSSASGTVDEATQNTITFSGRWITFANVSAGPSTVYFLEQPPVGNVGVVSDILHYTITDNGDGSSTITGDFTSDVPESFGLLNLSNLAPGESTWLEQDGAYTITATGLGATITSDAEPVPLPSTAMGGMVLLGGLGLVIAARRRPQQA
jgi:hypothetical protein